MQNSRKPFNPQDIYPDAQTVSGMAAKKPTVFRVPLIKTTALLFIPVYFVTALATLYMSSGETSRDALAINSIALFMAILLTILVSIVLIASARTIIVRNCSHPFIIELMYVALVAPTGYLLTQYSTVWFVGVPFHLIAIQAVILAAETFLLVLIAHASSRH